MSARSLVTNPLAQFLVIGSVLVAGLVIGTTVLSNRAAREEALNDARATTTVLASSVAQPAIRRGLVEGNAGAIDRFDREVLDRLLVTDVQRIKIWAEDGTIIYSDRAELIGSQYALGEEELEILREGGVEAEVSDLTKPENRFERSSGGLVEVYTQIWSPEGTPLLFEAYYSDADIAERQQMVFLPFRRIFTGALLALIAAATPLIWVLTRRLTRASRERARLLGAAVDASAAERRRIARDLHDGVVQDLAGTAFSLSALGRDGSLSAEGRTTIDNAGRSLRASLRSLRSLLVEIHPPDLTVDGLGSALEDLLAPAASAGIEASVSVSDVDGTSDRALALVWRVAQEAVRNAIRHGRPETMSVVVTGDEDLLFLDVADDGQGFDPELPRPDRHFGLRGLGSLVHDAGGRLVVRSAPGDGTVIHLEVTKQ